MSVPPLPRGWYPDPTIPTLQRYWNGTAWTEHTLPAPAAPSADHPAAAQPPAPVPRPRPKRPPKPGPPGPNGITTGTAVGIAIVADMGGI